VKEAPLQMTIPMLVLCLLSIVLGIYPKPILDPLLQVVEQLIHV
jgi:formate hydrogenlyase subunit 3/multisubunit Na+/H+ antiporter MnhD subunit